LLYCFSGFLCGVVLLGVTLHNQVHGEFLALLVGGSGCLAFLLILTSRRDELASLRDDLRARFARKNQERLAAKATWEAIQKIELCETQGAVWDVLVASAESLGCDHLQVTCICGGREILRKSSPHGVVEPPASGSVATFRLKSGEDLLLTVTLHQSAVSEIDADIAFRALQRLSLATAQRLDWLTQAQDHESPPAGTSLIPGDDPLLEGDRQFVARPRESAAEHLAVRFDAPVAGPPPPPGAGADAGKDPPRWFRWAFYWGSEGLG